MLLNAMRDAGGVLDYALFGTAALMRYTEPVTTFDADVVNEDVTPYPPGPGSEEVDLLRMEFALQPRDEILQPTYLQRVNVCPLAASIRCVRVRAKQ
jgi:hypothetical protein